MGDCSGKTFRRRVRPKPHVDIEGHSHIQLSPRGRRELRKLTGHLGARRQVG